VADDLSDAVDEELARRARAGDQAAAAELYRRYAPQLRARVQRRLGGGIRRKVGASDVVQETCLAAFRDLDGFRDRGPGSFRRWLARIADCRADDEVRRWAGAERRAAGREESVGSAGAPPEPAAAGPTPSGEASDAEEREALVRAIRELAADDQLVLRLVGIEGRDFDEAGRALGRSPEAARKLYARAVVRLTARLRRDA